MTFFHYSHIQAMVSNPQTANFSLTFAEINVSAVCLYSSRLDYILGFLLSNVLCATFCLYEEMVIKLLCV